MLKVRVQNFQSIKDSTIEIDGFTVITGSNNSGKSAFVRALRGLFTNARGHHFVRHGATNCSVEITFPDGQTVTWEKGKSVNRYIVNGKILDKVGIGVPPEVQAFGVLPIALAGQEYWPQIAPQFTGQVFLIDQPGSVLAEAVSDIEKVSKLNKSLKQAETDKRSNQSKISVREEDLKKAEGELASYKGLEIVEALYEFISGLHSKSSQVKKGAEYVSATLPKLTAYREGVQNLLWAESMDLSEINTLISDSQATQKSLSYAATTQQNLLKNRAQINNLGWLDSVSLEDLQKVSTQATEVKSQASSAASYLKSLSNTRKAITSLEAITLGLEESLPDVSKVSKASAAVKLVREFKSRKESLLKDLEDAKHSLASKERDLDSVNTLIEDILQQLGVCPTCGSTCKELVHG